MQRLLRRGGFTLVELLVVILVVAVLLAVAAPSFLGLLGRAHDSAAKQYLTVAWKSARADAVDHDGYYNVVGTDRALRVKALTELMNYDNPNLVVSGGDCRAVLGLPANFIAVDDRVPSSSDSGGSSPNRFQAYSQSRSSIVWRIEGLSAHDADPGPRISKACDPVDTDSFPLEVVRAGSGGGVVSSAGAGGIDCGATCQADFASETQVTLTATPNAVSGFVRWGGDCAGTDPSCVISSMDSPKNVVAVFDVQSAPGESGLGVLFAGDGSGRVTSAPAGIDCASSCVHSFGLSTSVTLTANAGSGSSFSGWSGDCSGAGPCTLEVANDHEVTANFDGNAGGTVPLLVSLTSGLLGRVESVPAGISCAADCRENYAAADGTAVDLIATPTPGASFMGWSGDCSGTASCHVTMTRLRSVRASFAVEGSGGGGGRFDLLTLYQVADSSGKGVVTFTAGGSPRTRSCVIGGGFDGLACMFVAREGTELRFKATAARGSSFSGWEYPNGQDSSGGASCSGSTSDCNLTVIGGQALGAQFDLSGCSASEQLIRGVCQSGTRSSGSAGGGGSGGGGGGGGGSQVCTAGNGGLNGDVPNDAAGAPANDDFCHAQQLTGESGTVTGTLSGATVENGQSPTESNAGLNPGDPGYDGDALDEWGYGARPTRSVWFVWTAPTNDFYYFDSNDDYPAQNVAPTHPMPVVIVWRGTVFNAVGSGDILHWVNGSWSGSSWSQASFNAVAGQQYVVELENYPSNGVDAPPYTLNWHHG
jgi:prepilin-type N-terminal cleavage/methylation domain-containing protein